MAKSTPPSTPSVPRQNTPVAALRSPKNTPEAYPSTPAVVLNDALLRAIKPREKPFKRYDAGCTGLFLLTTPGGSKLWRLRYWYDGKEKLLAIGPYPATGLAKAREEVTKARAALARGEDPGAAKQAEKAAKRAPADSFKSVAEEWLKKFSADWTDKHRARIRSRLEKELFPYLGKRPIRNITAPELLAAVRRVESRGALELAHRTLQHASAVFRYAVATGRAERDPAADLRGALPPVSSKHFAALTTPADVGALLRAIDGFTGTAVVWSALKLAPLVFVRPGELRKAEWSEIDLDDGEWRIPAEKMKMREAHLVPLSRQAVAILRDLQPLTGSGRYVFPNERTNDRPMSEAAILAALRRLGYSANEMTGHGFRTIASTLLNEFGFKPDIIERQLAHRERNQVRAAYNRAAHLDERRKMMQAWADYLDGLKAGGKVITLRAGKATSSEV